MLFCKVRHSCRHQHESLVNKTEAEVVCWDISFAGKEYSVHSTCPATKAEATHTFLGRVEEMPCVEACAHRTPMQS